MPAVYIHTLNVTATGRQADRLKSSAEMAITCKKRKEEEEGENVWRGATAKAAKAGKLTSKAFAANVCVSMFAIDHNLLQQHSVVISPHQFNLEKP